MNDDMTLFTDNAAKDFSEPEVTEFDTQLEEQLLQDGDDTGWDDIKSTVHGMLDDVMKQWVSLESDMLLHSNFDKLTTISQVIQDSGTVTQADRITLESLGVDINRLPIISSYTKTPSKVNQVVTLEAINAAMAVAIGVIAVALAAIIALLKKLLSGGSASASVSTEKVSREIKAVEDKTQKTLAEVKDIIAEDKRSTPKPVQKTTTASKLAASNNDSTPPSKTPEPSAPVVTYDKASFEKDLTEWLSKKSDLTNDEKNQIVKLLSLNNLTNSPKQTQSQLFDVLIGNRLRKASIPMEFIDPRARILETGEQLAVAVQLSCMKLEVQHNTIARDNGQKFFPSIINTPNDVGLKGITAKRNELRGLLTSKSRELRFVYDSRVTEKMIIGTNMMLKLQYFQNTSRLDKVSKEAAKAVAEMPNTARKLQQTLDKLKSSEDFPGKAQLIKNYEIFESDLRLNTLTYVYLEKILWFRKRVWESTMSVHKDCNDIATFVAKYFGVK